MADLSQLQNYWHVLDPNAPGAGDLLAQLRQYDPSAQYVPRVSQTSEGVQFDPYYQLSFDPRTLPGIEGTGQLPIPEGYTGTANIESSRGRELGGVSFPGGLTFAPSAASDYQMRNPTLLQYSPVYGNLTPASNLYDVRPDRGTWLDIVGPLAVGAFGFGAPALASAMSGGALGGAAGSFSAPWQLNAGLSTAKQVGSGQFNPLGFATSWAPGLNSLFGVPPELAQGLQLGSRAYGALNAFNEPARAPQTELTFNPQNFGKLNQPLVPSGDTTPVAESQAFSPYYGSNRGRING